MTARDRHNALDVVMAKWAIMTRRRYSQGTVAELIEFADTLGRVGDAEWGETLAAFNDLVARAEVSGFALDQNILHLMEWSYRELNA
jgi:hypothetical protein